MFPDEFEKAWQILRSEGTVHDSPHVNIALNTGRVLNDVKIYDRKEYKDDNGRVINREVILLTQEGMQVIPLQDITTLKIM